MHNRINPLVATLLASTIAFSVNAQAGLTARVGLTLASSRAGTHQKTAVPIAPDWKLKATLLGHTSTVWSVAFFPDSRRLVTASEDGSIRMWDVITATQLKEVSGSQGSVSDIAVSPDGTLIAACIDSEESSVVKIWDAVTLKLLHTLAGHEKGIFVIVFSPDGRLLASGARDKSIKLWNVRTGQLVRTLEGHTDAVTSLAFTPNGKWLFTASAEDDKTIKLWEVGSGKLLRTQTGHEEWVTALAISPDGATLVSGGRDKNIILWDVKTGAKQSTLKQSGMIFELEFSHDGKTLVQVGDGLQIYDTRTWTMMGALEGHDGQISDVKFSPNGKLLVTASYDNTVNIWEPKR
jgi:WD40 repeat protein